MLFGLDMQTLLLSINLITVLDFSKILIGKFLLFGCILYIGTVFFFSAFYTQLWVVCIMHG